MSNEQIPRTKRYDLSLSDLVDRFGFTEAMFRDWAKRSGLPHFQNGDRGKLMFSRSDVETWIRANVKNGRASTQDQNTRGVA